MHLVEDIPSMGNVFRVEALYGVWSPGLRCRGTAKFTNGAVAKEHDPMSKSYLDRLELLIY